MVVGALFIAGAVGIPVEILVSRTGSSGGTASPGSGSTPAPTPAPSTANPQAVALYQTAMQAAEKSSGFHYVATSTGGGVTQTTVGDAGQADGSQTLTEPTQFGNEKFNLVLTSDGTVYFQGNAPALEDQVGVSASASPGLANSWIAVAVGEGPYSNLEAAMTVGSQLQYDSFDPRSTVTVTGPGGTSLTRIAGIVPVDATNPDGGTARIDISPSSHLPVTLVITATAGSASETTTVDFTEWGTAPSVAAPSGAVAWSTLGAVAPIGGYGSGEAPTAGPTPTPQPTPTPTPTPGGSV